MVELKKIVLLAFVLVVFSTTVIVGYVQPVVAEGDVHIMSDGSVFGTDKIQHDGRVYIFTGNIFNQSIIVERDNIIIDGSGYSLQGPETFFVFEIVGINLGWRKNVTIKNLRIKAFTHGIGLYGSANNTICQNSITNNGFGIWIQESSKNKIVGNNITDSATGVHLHKSFSNTISENIITSNTDDGIVLSRSTSNTISRNYITAHVDYGIFIWDSSNNTFYHNTFIDNYIDVDNYGLTSTNYWNCDYPISGNYWSKKGGVDCYSGLRQNETGSDGIFDAPYTLDGNNLDFYPLVKPWSPLPMKVFDVFWKDVHYLVTTLSNASLTHFVFNQTMAQISFKATGESGTVGYCNVTHACNLLWGEFTVLIDGNPLIELVRKNNATHTSLYFTCELQSTRTVQIVGTEVIPEFPT